MGRKCCWRRAIWAKLAEGSNGAAVGIASGGGESEAAWRGVLDNLIARGLRTPAFLVHRRRRRIGEGACGVVARGAHPALHVSKHRNLLAHAPEALHEEISADYTDMIYAKTAKEIETRRRAFLRKWRLKCRAVADSLEEDGERVRKPGSMFLRHKTRHKDGKEHRYWSIVAIRDRDDSDRVHPDVRFADRRAVIPQLEQ